MAWEAAAAVVVGLAMLALVLHPLVARWAPAPPRYEPEEQEETPKGVALAALREIEFDRETGKLSDDDYALLKTKYSEIALEALRNETPEVAAPAGGSDLEALIAARVRALRSGRAAASATVPACSTCGPRPEPDAAFCSTCGLPLGTVGQACPQCAATLSPGSRFCESCGSRVAA